MPSKKKTNATKTVSRAQSKSTAQRAAPKPKMAAQSRKAQPALRDSRMFDIPTYAQSEEFTSAAACAIMVLKYSKRGFKGTREDEFEIWQDAVNGSVWHGSRYGLAYALAKRGLKPMIVSNFKDEGYERRLAVYDGVKLETLMASFAEIKKKAAALRVREVCMQTSANLLKKQISSGRIPIALVNISAINPSLEPSPHWVVVKGYDKDAFYINDPYSDSTVAMQPEVFKNALGFDNECCIVSVSAKKR
ncbi:MAG: peptidase C39 family protein [Candidatus Marsarchaeota archaeon]|nr:peptidase C39 family protein [Candidatus Marsarchaeota archaeon]